MNPKLFQTVRFNAYITEYLTELLNRLSREEDCPKTDLVREAIHSWLRERGIDDGLSYDQKDDEKWLAEIFPHLKKESIDPEELRRLLFEQMR